MQSHSRLMKWGYKYGVANVKTLGNLLRFHKNREDFNEVGVPDTAASVHDVLLFYNAFLLSNFLFKARSSKLLHIT